jgi:hypothetical protein
MSTLRTGARTPFFATNISNYHSLAAIFSPIDNSPAAYSDSEEEVYIKNGFLIKNATANAGLAYVVTWETFEAAWSRVNHHLVTKATVLATINPVAVYLTSGQWLECPVVKVHATSDQAFPTTITYINVGTIR